ncbi:uncharacterized protein C2845_PM02G18970 [Panicum miliaceum]|uniref:Thymic stromal cotransporter n=1 Tax=Panicum miliaceum TaxID=4540 RepID=A0A3L6S881_PANMI|nr:uncharacterized protein C2845_PM02G18970 [Panicum miliaceum]
MATTAAATGLAVAATDPIRSFLSSAAASGDLGADLRELASALSSEPAVPYRSLRAIWCAASPDARPPLRSLLRGADFVLPSPKPREKSDELKARLEKLREMQERKEYAELVKDVAPPSREDSPEPFSSYKDQIGFGISKYAQNPLYNGETTKGLHVVVIMFTGYLVGFAMFRALFNNSPVLNAAGGILGLVGGMLVETILFIIRSSSKELASSVPRSKKVQ